jgi:chemotaxis protein methyltransferase CheR
MEADALTEMQWERLAGLIAANTGLHFPPARRADLIRGLNTAARETDFRESAQYAEWLLSAGSTPGPFRALARHLTVGETYFFREGRTLDALSGTVLPELIERRRGVDQHLRLWSAACSTGEEAYSLAMLLDRLLPEQRGWRITILATDINERALAKAAAGIYGEWSFRAFPAEMRERYFARTAAGRFAIHAEIRRRVTFAPLNLAADEFPSWRVDSRAMDLILCRNVLMYFAAEQARKLVGKVHESLAEDGWLAVSPSECSQALFSRFAVVNFPDAILYRKRDRAARGGERGTREAPVAHSSAVGRAEERTLLDVAKSGTSSPARLGNLARDAANRGQLSEALALSEQWIAADKVDSTAHYLHATVLREMRNCEAARRAFQRCLFLQPDFALAHFALGNLERSESQHAAARRHFENARRLLGARPAEDLIPEAEGLTFGHLAAMIATLLDLPTSTAPFPPLTPTCTANARDDSASDDTKPPCNLATVPQPRTSPSSVPSPPAEARVASTSPSSERRHDARRRR